MTRRGSLLNVIGAWLAFALVCPALLRGDDLEVITPGGSRETMSGRLYASSDDAVILQQPSGELRFVPTAAIVKRTPGGGDFKPLTCQEMKVELEKRFTAEQTRWVVDEPFVVGLVLMAPLTKEGEAPAQNFLKKAGRFMNNVEGIFLRFCKEMRIETSVPEFPLVLLIFESDDDFEAYASMTTGNQGVSAGRILGFYNKRDNFLAIRLSECHTFEVPLHEAIHQQAYNRGMVKRFAPVPAWFDEGLATGFEGDGEKISQGPTKLRTLYANIALSAQRVNWKQIVQLDEAFRGDSLAGEAYSQAWGLHWLLVTRHKVEYMKYLDKLSSLEPLSMYSDEERLADLTKIFGPLDVLEKEFEKVLKNSFRKQGNEQSDPPGTLTVTSSLSRVQVTAVGRADRPGIVQAQGELRNVSPFREMSYRVRLLTDAGAYAEWVVHGVKVNQVVSLPSRITDRVLPGAGGGSGRSFRVEVTGTMAGSEVDQSWREAAGAR